MTGDTFYDQLTERYLDIQSLLCVGLDPRQEDLQPDKSIYKGLLAYVDKIVAATKDYALVYKANVAYFEQFGLEGYTALEGLRRQIPRDIPLILDAKRGDIGVTAKAYATALYDKLHADAVTVNGYMGSDSITPFTDRVERGVFVLCKTSNPSGDELQSIVSESGDPIYIHQADLARGWNENHNVGLVVGATYSQELKKIRKRCPDMWILAPGIGAQGGDLEATLQAGLTSFGGLLINVGRGISRAKNPRQAAKTLVKQMREIITTKNNAMALIDDTIKNCEHEWFDQRQVLLDVPWHRCVKCGDYIGHHCQKCHLCYDCR